MEKMRARLSEQEAKVRAAAEAATQGEAAMESLDVTGLLPAATRGRRRKAAAAPRGDGAPSAAATAKRRRGGHA